ncbi:MAG TPA: aminoglycoside phosphotransferase family protein [Candidatus Dependentiae bacterium]|nr:aminoglycoside phosphotransferase family protein [Candidatus Dependentiae bacterium]HRQ62588.1 aminoglycoside phosphotransferase family protein [Candidatus Dependentiae bacterium]
MTEKQFLSNQRIIDCLNTDYGIEVAALTFIPLGADVNASVYKAQAHDNSTYFVKIKHSHHCDIGVMVQQMLHDSGIPQIIAPIKTKYGKSTHYIDDFTFIVYPFIQGLDGFNCALTNEQWVMLGKALRQIHEFQLPPFIKDKIRHETYSSKWCEAVRSIYTYIDTNPQVTDEIALNLLTLMQEHRETIQRLVDRAEQLGQQIQKKSLKFVLCHSDIHAGNVLIANDSSLYIVDWDQPIMAPKERDLMFIGGGVGNVWNDLHEEEFFYEGYGKTEINKDILAYYRYERIVEDIAEYNQQLLLTTDDTKNRAEMYKQFVDMFMSQGVIDITFKTDTHVMLKN